MRRDVSVFWTLSVMALLAPTAANAFIEPAQATKAGRAHLTDGATPFSVGIRVVRPRLSPASTSSFASTTSGGDAQVSIDQQSGAVRLISGGELGNVALESTGPLALDDLLSAAKAFVTAHAGALGVNADDLRLNAAATLIDADDQFLKFEVWRDGLQVRDAGVDFRFKRGKLLQIVNQSFGEAAGDARPAQAGLERVVEGALLATDVKGTGEAYRVVEKAGGYDLVRVARFDAVSQTGERFQVEVEAATGALFEVRPTTFHLEGSASGQVYDRYYSESLVVRPYSEIALTYDGGTTTTDRAGDFAGAPDASQPRLDGFSGPRVRIALSSGTKVVAAGARVRDSWNVIYSRTGTDPVDNDKNVAQSMVFFHANEMIQRAKNYVASPWFDRQLTANVNLTQTCNAHWDGTTINFYSGGGGCANTGLISDVVFHEWGHGLDHNTGGIADGGFSEGFGDIMSLIMTQSNVLGIGFRTDGSPVRDLAPDKVYPRDAGGGVHSEGLIIGSTFYDLYTALKEQFGAERTVDLLSRYSLKMIYTATRYTDVYDALLVIDDDNGDLSDKTPNYCTLNKTFAAHGLATADEACNLASVDLFEVDDRAGGNGNGIAEPGESVKLWLTARNGAGNALDGLTGTLRVSGANGVTVTDAAMAWDQIPARGISRSRDAAAIDVASNVTCGAKVTATVALVSGDRNATVGGELMVGRLSASARAYGTQGLPMPIRDNQSTTATIDVANGDWDAATTVHAARLKFDLTHTYVGDLTVDLVSPEGVSKQVFKGSGSTADAHIDMDASSLVAGLKGLGAWKLVVTDAASQDEGTLDAAELTLTPANYICE